MRSRTGDTIMANADLVLEGGGVKGTALVGAITALTENADPYTFHRIAGTSAGAIVASLFASGYDAAELGDVMNLLDFSKFEDESEVFKHLKQFGEGFGLLFHEGLFKGEFLQDWLTETLAAKNVRTWGDLKDVDPASSLPADQQYRLVVDPDKQRVADAVRSSAGIPFFFRPFHMKADPTVTQGHGEILCTDGGMLSNFPVD